MLLLILLTIFRDGQNLTRTSNIISFESLKTGIKCRILKSSFNNRQRRIESLRRFYNLFLK